MLQVETYTASTNIVLHITVFLKSLWAINSMFQNITNIFIVLPHFTILIMDLDI